MFAVVRRCSLKRSEMAHPRCSMLCDDEDEEKSVGALPKKRQTNSRQGFRRQHHKIKIPQLKICPQCKQARLSHHACPNCGTYRGRQVIPVRERRAATE
ncbi:MAG TPA: 50S ribosomal protein L32 [Ktedonobacterales bacterium]|nr:50S ribosomal protein L32 [Ktedonobacterales bacterium]